MTGPLTPRGPIRAGAQECSSLLGQPHILQASVHPVVGHGLVVVYFGRPYLAAGPG